MIKCNLIIQCKRKTARAMVKANKHHYVEKIYVHKDRMCHNVHEYASLFIKSDAYWFLVFILIISYINVLIYALKHVCWNVCSDIYCSIRRDIYYQYSVAQSRQLSMQVNVIVSTTYMHKISLKVLQG